MAQNIDQKLRATACLLGAVTRKDLAAAFRRVNAATSFDVERAHKWMQGRAHPREAQLYQDWAALLDVDRSGEWVANCDFQSFVEIVAARHSFDHERLRASGGEGPVGRQGKQVSNTNRDLIGTYVCYSHAWSPYFRGQIIRGALSITSKDEASELHATYTEALPTGSLQVSGTLSVSRRAISFCLQDADGDAQLLFCLFPPTLPVRVLGGLMCGATIIGSDPSPSTTRIVMIRLPPASLPSLEKTSPYLPANTSLANDLAGLGFTVSSPDSFDEDLAKFLNARDEGSVDQPSPSDFRALIERFDREWVNNLHNSHASRDGTGENRRT
jgi:hypothetical protein